MDPGVPAAASAPRRASAGFTLIELMVVVAIVAILAAIAIPSYQDSVRKGHRGQAKADLVDLAQLAERYRTVNGTYAGFAATLSSNYLRSPRTGDTVRYAIARSNADTVDNAVVFTATPQGGQASDRCGNLAINAAGQKWHSTGTEAECQFGSVGSPPP